MEKEIKLKLENVYGGDGVARPMVVEEVKLKRSKVRVTVRQDIGMPVESMKKERKTETKEIAVNTFKRNKDNKPMLRLGGSHGKLWGAMKSAGEILYQIGEMQSKAMVGRILRAVQISPEWVTLENGKELKTEIIPQLMNTPGQSQVQQYFDVIPECDCIVNIKYPDALDEQVTKLLQYTQSINSLNKRRGKITILN